MELERKPGIMQGQGLLNCASVQVVEQLSLARLKTKSGIGSIQRRSVTSSRRSSQVEASQAGLPLSSILDAVDTLVDDRQHSCYLIQALPCKQDISCSNATSIPEFRCCCL